MELPPFAQSASGLFAQQPDDALVPGREKLPQRRGAAAFA
jgi:hypothetical protein